MKLAPPDRFADGIALGFEDVLIAPGQALVNTDGLNLRTALTAGIALSQPFIVTTSQGEQAIACAQQGVIGFVPSSLSPSAQAAAVRAVKRYQTRVVQNPITVTIETSIAEVADLQTRYDISGIPVLEVSSQRVIGIVTKESITPKTDMEQPVSTIMSQDGLIMLQDSGNVDEVDALMRKHGVKRIILTDRDQRCIGMVTTRDMDRIRSTPKACMDTRSRLRVGAVIGIEDQDMDRVAMLIDEQVDALMVVGSPLHIKKTSDMITHIRRQRAGHVDVIVGPVMTKAQARAWIDAGANALFLSPEIPADYLACGIGTKPFSMILELADACAVQSIPLFFQGTATGDVYCKAVAGGVYGFIVDDTVNRDTVTEALKQGMLRLGCSSLEQMRTEPRFIRLK